jgi:hypothetical protein
MGPARLKGINVNGRFHERQGQAVYNAWVAGALGFVRLGRRFEWEETSLGYYALAKLAMARVAQARYVEQLHAMGLARGPLTEEGRHLCHIDRSCALLQWSTPYGRAVDQEFAPFIDLVGEVGALLRTHAQPGCRIYLDYLDYAVPFWFLVEAPKQSACEQRVCPFQHYNGNVLAQYWILGKRGEAFRNYVDTTRFTGDLFYIQNLAALLDSFARQ